jgi:hypothetical protein
MPQIFVSHISAERELAALLKEKIERHFLGFVDVFVSSDQESIQAGESWLEALRRALKAAHLQVILCSPQSISRPWVNFEAGAAWLQGIPVVPLCHSGLTMEQLPMPLSTLQGGEISDPDTYVRLYKGIAKLVPCECPDIDMKALAQGVSKLEHAPNAVPEAVAAKPAQQEWTLEQLRGFVEAGNQDAIQTIAVTQSPEAFSLLMDLAVNHIDDAIKIAAIKALSSFRAPGDIKPLCELLVRDRWQVAEACAKALGRFKNPTAIPYLIRASDQHVDWVTTRDSVTALGVFAPLQPETICPALIRALELGSFEGEAAAQSLLRYGSLGLNYILDGLADGSLFKGSTLALKTVVLIGDKSAIPKLEQVREQWQTALNAAPAEDARPGLMDFRFSARDAWKSMLTDMDKAIVQLKNMPAIRAAEAAG